jgi:tetratricopeptide (TPR) repeat protein
VLGPTAPALDAARSLVEGTVPSTAMARAVAQTLLSRAAGPPDRQSIEPLSDDKHPAALHDLRYRLRGNPRNAVRWADLARLYTIVAQPDKARQAVRIALALAPNDRYVLRSAARLAVHLREYDRAHAIIAAARVTPTDPWLVASEIAIADVSGTRPSYVRRAREMLADAHYSDFEVNEVASALATRELESGDHRASRRLFRRALQSPTDNTLAQVAWARVQVGLTVDEEVFNAPGSWEARAVAARQRGDWRQSIAEAELWLDDQPFASRPAQLGSYEASKGGDFERGAQFAERGLVTNPDEFALRNNAAFCLLSDGEVESARPHLTAMSRLKLDSRQRAVALATFGLFYYRTGDRDTGHARYLQAIRTARDSRTRALAQLMLAREELLFGSSRAAELLSRARRDAEEVDARELEPWLKQLDVSSPTPRGAG